MTTQHTPGPWHVDECDTDARTYIQSEGDNEIANIQWGALKPDQWEQANARLIAAAPTMLDALSVIEDWIMSDDTLDTNGHILRLARAAIAKARGVGAS